MAKEWTTEELRGEIGDNLVDNSIFGISKARNMVGRIGGHIGTLIVDSLKVGNILSFFGWGRDEVEVPEETAKIHMMEKNLSDGRNYTVIAFKDTVDKFIDSFLVLTNVKGDPKKIHFVDADGKKVNNAEIIHEENGVFTTLAKGRNAEKNTPEPVAVSAEYEHERQASSGRAINGTEHPSATVSEQRIANRFTRTGMRGRPGQVERSNSSMEQAVREFQAAKSDALEGINPKHLEIERQALKEFGMNNVDPDTAAKDIEKFGGFSTPTPSLRDDPGVSLSFGGFSGKASLRSLEGVIHSDDVEIGAAPTTPASGKTGGKDTGGRAG